MHTPKPGGLIANIANTLIDHAPMLALPRWRVLADVRAVYGCGDLTAREAYAVARVESKTRARRDTTPYARSVRA